MHKNMLFLLIPISVFDHYGQVPRVADYKGRKLSRKLKNLENREEMRHSEVASSETPEEP